MLPTVEMVGREALLTVLMANVANKPAAASSFVPNIIAKIMLKRLNDELQAGLAQLMETGRVEW